MKRIACLLLCLLLHRPVFAQQEHFREWQFQVPAGWQFTVQRDFALLAPSDAPTGTVCIKLFPGQTISANLQTWLDTRAATDTQGMRIVQSIPVAVFPVGRPSVFQKLVGVDDTNGQRSGADQ